MKQLILSCLIIIFLSNCNTKSGSPNNTSSPNPTGLKDISDLNMALMDTYSTKAIDLLGEPDLDDKYVNGTGAHYMIYYYKVLEDKEVKDLLIYTLNDDAGNRVIKKVMAVTDGDKINIPHFGVVLIKKPVAEVATDNGLREIDNYVASIDSNKLHHNSFRNEIYETKVYTSNSRVVLMTLTGLNTVPGNDDYNTERYYFKNGALIYMYKSDEKNYLYTTTLYIVNNNIVKYLRGKEVTPCSQYDYGCTFDENSAVLTYLANYNKQYGLK